MAVTESHVLSAVTVGTSELSVLSGTTTLQNNTTPGAYQLFVDGVAAGMAKGDQFRIRIYEKVKAASTKRKFFEHTLRDGQSEPWVSPTVMLLNGWDMTIQKLAGTDRAFDASVRKAG